MRKNNIMSCASFLCFVIAGQAYVGSVSAQKDEAYSSVIDEVLVTAQRRTERLSDVGIAVNAFSGQQLKKLGFTNSLDIAKFAPGVYISSDTGGQNKKFTIRGVAQNDFMDAVESPIAIYVDDAYIAPQQGQVFGLFDLERVEVLKGPQGTLYGRNATGGLVHYISRKPDIGENEGFFDLTYGSHSQVRVEAGGTITISDKLAVRASVLSDQHDPLIKNSFPSAADLMDRDTKAARLHLVFKPRETVNVRLTATGARSEQSSGSYETQAIVPVFDGSGRWIDSVLASPTETRPGIGVNGASVPVFGVTVRPTPGGDLFGYKEEKFGDFKANMNHAQADANRYTSWGMQSVIDVELSDAYVLKSVSDYREFTKVASLDVDVSPIEQFTYMADAGTETFSQEFNISYSGDRFNWVGGVYYLRIDNDTLQGLPFASDSILNGGATTPGLDFTTEVALKTRSMSAYGQFDYQFSEQFSFVGGARVVRERKNFDYAQNAYVNLDEDRIENDVLAFPVPQPAGSNPYHDKFSKTLWLGKAQLEFRPDDGYLLYAGVNRGVKAGSVNGPLADGSTVNASQLVYGPEVLWSYEGGFKIRTADNMIGINGSVYYYDYNDYQAFTFVNVSGVVSNEQASVKGAELEITAQPTEALSALLSGSINDSKVKDLQYAPGLFKDVKSVYSPKYQFS